MTTFDFSKFMMAKGFTFTNYGTHNLHEIEKDNVHYSVNLQGEKMTTNNSKDNDLKVDIPAPKDEKSAEKWLKDFLK